MLPYLAEEESVYAHCTARARTRTRIHATEHVESAFRHKNNIIWTMTNTDKIITRTMTLYHLVTVNIIKA